MQHQHILEVTLSVFQSVGDSFKCHFLWSLRSNCFFFFAKFLFHGLCSQFYLPLAFSIFVPFLSDFPICSCVFTLHSPFTHFLFYFEHYFLLWLSVHPLFLFFPHSFMLTEFTSYSCVLPQPVRSLLWLPQVSVWLPGLAPLYLDLDFWFYVSDLLSPSCCIHYIFATVAILSSMVSAAGPTLDYSLKAMHLNWLVNSNLLVPIQMLFAYYISSHCGNDFSTTH